MLREFLKTNRSELIDRCRAKVATRRAPRATPAELEHGVPLFLEQLTGMLQGEPGDLGEIGGKRAARPSSAEWHMQDSATKHGHELLLHDFTIDQVVYDYGDLCQSITEVASEQKAPITVEEFGILNIRLDNAIAGAVTEYNRQQEISVAEEEALASTERLGALAHEMRNLLNTAIVALSAIKSGSVGFGGATAAALDRSLLSMRALIDRSLAQVRLDAGAASLQTIEMDSFVAEVGVAAALEATNRGCELTVLPVERGIAVKADRHILAAAVANLLQNAFKFTRAHSHVLLRTYAAKGRVMIEVEDECGGLPQNMVDQLFRPFEQRATDRSGVGLGLSISRQGVEGSGGKLYARNIAGKGCVFTIDLPQVQQESALQAVR